MLALLAGAGLLTLAVAFLRAQTFDVAALASGVPARTALMRQREREAARDGRPYAERRRWVPYASLSPHLRHAVLIAEDDAFFSHDGLDWNEIRESARRDWEAKRIVRGGSTITQQLAKNLWLGTSRSPLRKFEEVLLARRLEQTLGKRRIFELYLNVIEWGDGVYGADAAARRWFGTTASNLSPEQSVRLAAVIINPRRYSPTEPSRRIQNRIRLITSRLRRRGQLPAPLPPAAAPADSAPPEDSAAPYLPPPPPADPPDSGASAHARPDARSPRLTVTALRASPPMTRRGPSAHGAPGRLDG